MKSFSNELWFNVPSHDEFDDRRRKRVLVKIIGE
jgi:hypothetical protein